MKEKNNNENRIDEAFARLLKRASDPAIPPGAEGRLMAAIRGTPQQSNLVQFKPRRPSRNWLVGLPLAASFLLGIYLGTKDVMDSYLPDGLIGASVAGVADSDISTGFDDVEQYADGEVT
jgi:hypothetical protein